MDAGLIVMLVCLGIFLVLAIIGLVLVARSMLRLYRIGSSLQERVDAEVRLLMEQQEAMTRKIEFIQAQGQVIQQNSQALSASMDKLAYLGREFSAAREQLRNVTSLQL